MRRFTVISALCILSAVCARGQEPSARPSTPAQIGMNFARSLWFGSLNAAGMAVDPLGGYNFVSVNYGRTSGDFRSLQRGERETTAAFDTNGAVRIGKWALWGDFSFSRDFWKGAAFNVNLYTLDPDMPYYVADNAVGDWNKQSYDMSLKAAVPLFRDRLYAGVAASYGTYKGARQIDARGVPIGYGIEAAPSLAVRLWHRHIVGAAGFYSDAYESSTFSNTLETGRAVYLMKGLGNFTIGNVSGTQGITQYVYPKRGFGFSAQYGYSGVVDILAEAYYSLQTTDAIHRPDERQMMGTAKKKKKGASVGFKWGRGESLHGLKLEVCRTDTGGTEYVQELKVDGDGIQRYVTIVSMVMSDYRYRSVRLSYDGFFRGGVWNAGARAGYSDRTDRYFSPSSSFGYANVYAELYGRREFSLGKAFRLRAGLTAGYNYNLDGGYEFGGSDSGHVLVTGFYPHELSVLASDYLRLNPVFDFTYILKNRDGINISASYGYTRSFDLRTGRHSWDFALAYIF